MKIHKLRLINCKCYRDKTIGFQAGVNFISGVNGAGKTTIIEAIGFALFNYLPYSARQFVREGESSGEIQLLIEANDERLYTIIRKFNKTSKSLKWEVLDEETGTALNELHGSIDVACWIKDNIGVDQDDSLEGIFQQVIAVAQGLFTAPFLETEANRKRIFDAILKVEGYREAFDQSRSLKTYIEGEEEKLQLEINYLKKDLEVLPSVREGLEKALEKQQQKASEYDLLQKEKEELEKSVKQLSELKEKSEAKKSEAKLLAQKQESLKENIAGLTRQKQEARKAQQVIKETTAAYQRYQLNQKGLREWEKRKQQKDELRLKLEKKDKLYSMEQRSLEVEAKNLSLRVQEAESKLVKLNQLKDEAARGLAAAEGDYKQVCDWGNDTKVMGQPYTRLQDWLAAKDAAAVKAGHLLESLNTMQLQIGEVRAALKDVPLKQERLKELIAAVKKGEELQGQKAALEARMETLKQSQANLREGLCPIIQEPCPSEKVQGDLGGFFRAELAELAQGIEVLDAELKQQAALQAELDTLRAELAVAEGEQKRMETLEATKKGRFDELRRALQTSSLKEMADLVCQCQGELAKAEDLSDHANAWVASKDFVKVSPYQCELAGHADLEGLLEGSDAQTLDDLDAVQAWLKAWEQLAAATTAWAQAGHAKKEGLQQWLRDVLADVSYKGRELKTQKAAYAKELAEGEALLDRLKQDGAGLEERGKALKQLKGEIDSLGDELKQHAGVEERLAAIKDELQKDQQSYDLYKENLRMSEDLKRIEVETQAREAELHRTAETAKTLAAEIRTLLEDYDPQKHESLARDYQEATIKLAELGVSLKQVAKEAKQLDQQSQELLEKEAKYEESKKGLLVKRKTGELVQLIRETLKDAADPIAQVYRRHLSIQADELYRSVSSENVQLEWGLGYELQLRDYHQLQERVRVFKQLSGGEQMTAALAIRLALMKVLSDVKVGFFDEPTTNLDAFRRENLAAAIQSFAGAFEQLFVISHDDAFDALSENVIVLSKAGN